MTTTLLLARLLLSGVFVVASLAKFLDRAGARRSLTDFGVPSGLAGPGSLLLPIAELIVGVTLLPSATAFYGAVGALVLLLVFTAGIALNLARDRRPDCRCFGQLSSTPIGWPTVARNVALLAVSGVVVLAGGADSGGSLLAWAGPLTPLQQVAVAGGAIGVALLGLQSVLLLRLVRQNHQLLERATLASAAGPALVPHPLHAPAGAGRAIGTQAPDFTLPALDGQSWSLATLRAPNKPVVLFFSDPNCGPCAALLPEFAELEQKHAHALTVALISRGTADANREKTQGLARVLLQRDREVFEAFGVVGTPSVVLVNPDGTIGSALAQGDAEIRQLLAPLVLPLVQAALLPPVPASPLAPRAPAPDFTLTDLDGESLTLDRFKDRRRLVLFWNPSCGHCKNFLPDLIAWETSADADRPQLIVVSTGSLEDNRALGLQSPIGLDPDGFAVAHRYGARGTPSAALVNADGRLAADLAVGAPAVLALAGSPAPVVAPAGPPAELPDDAVPVKERCVHDELLPDGSMVLYNGCRNQVMTLNQTAALVWEYCDGTYGIDAIVTEVRDVFPNAVDANRDVRTVLRDLLAAGMISPKLPDHVESTAGVGPEADARS